ncbi:MAG: ABC transporter substrate-binding protein [Gammaproteobacteria bacterium]|nr:ABC transporter substrate-binding protein [Gammaproteobacteria bacterium]
MKKTLLITTLVTSTLLLCGNSTSYAEGYFSAADERNSVAAEVSEPARILQGGITAITQFTQQQGDAAQLREFLTREVLPQFDFAQMASLAAGPLRRQLDPAQQQRLITLISEEFTETMVSRLATLHQSEITYLPPKEDRHGMVTLALRANSQNRPPIVVAFKLHRTAKGWKIFDVAANGANAVGYFREKIAQEVRAGGINKLLSH